MPKKKKKPPFQHNLSGSSIFQILVSISDLANGQHQRMKQSHLINRAATQSQPDCYNGTIWSLCADH